MMGSTAARAKTTGDLAGRAAAGEKAARRPLLAAESLQSLGGNHAISQLLGHGVALPEYVRTEMERRFDRDWDAGSCRPRASRTAICVRRCGHARPKPRASARNSSAIETCTQRVPIGRPLRRIIATPVSSNRTNAGFAT